MKNFTVLLVVLFTMNSVSYDSFPVLEDMSSTEVLVDDSGTPYVSWRC